MRGLEKIRKELDDYLQSIANLGTANAIKLSAYEAYLKCEIVEALENEMFYDYEDDEDIRRQNDLINGVLSTEEIIQYFYDKFERLLKNGSFFIEKNSVFFDKPIYASEWLKIFSLTHLSMV